MPVAFALVWGALASYLGWAWWITRVRPADWKPWGLSRDAYRTGLVAASLACAAVAVAFMTGLVPGG